MILLHVSTISSFPLSMISQILQITGEKIESYWHTDKIEFNYMIVKPNLINGSHIKAIGHLGFYLLASISFLLFLIDQMVGCFIDGHFSL